MQKNNYNLENKIDRKYNIIKILALSPVFFTVLAILSLLFRQMNIYPKSFPGIYYDIIFSIFILVSITGYLFDYLDIAFTLRTKYFIFISIIFNIIALILLWFSFLPNLILNVLLIDILINLILVISIIVFLYGHLKEIDYYNEILRVRSSGELDRSKRALTSYEKPVESDWINNIKSNISDIEKRLDNLSVLNLSLTKKQQSELLSKTKQYPISETIKKTSKEISSNIERTIKSDEKSILISYQMQKTQDRLTKELESLSSRGSLNLILGILITISGLIILGYFVFHISASSAYTVASFFIYFIPRLSLILFIEIFAYFFLRLYKAALSEIKYFQNELTNIEAKYLSTIISVLNENPDTISKILINLSVTERNFILEKDQMTVENQQNKIENEFEFKLLNLIPDIIRASNKKTEK